MKHARAILVALATAAYAAFGACGDDGDGGNQTARCQRLENDSSTTGCTLTAYECNDEREYTVDCLVTADGYDCKCRIDNTIDSEFVSADYCDNATNSTFSAPCGWSIGP
ncbi:MAG: hypothetical protein AAGF11_36320 [Myxococcota bacterium]